ncbi:sulfotransferase family protein [Isoptericola sp. NPDC057391]|uniref:sulfotransferase family protein n=1 Tax=Isoptericola sp. NPDC057391 TaxID=3346117 RepID=UPI00362E3F58
MQPPFFVIGAPRSGTSYLVEVLNRHPDVVMTNETRVMTFLYRALHRWSKDRMALMTERTLFLSTFRRHVPDIVRDFYRQLGATETSRWGDKFPHYADSKTDPGLLDLIAEAFPRCQFLHITRDGRDVVSSLLEKGWVDLDEACDVWNRHVVASQEIGLQVGADRFHELRYEDLVHDGPASVAEIFEFLRLPNSADVDAFLNEQARSRTPFSGATTRTEVIGESGWRERLTPEQAMQVDERLRPTLSATGYLSSAGEPQVAATSRDFR